MSPRIIIAQQVEPPLVLSAFLGGCIDHGKLTLTQSIVIGIPIGLAVEVV